METKRNLTKQKEIKKTQNNSTRELSLPFSSCVLGFSFFSYVSGGILFFRPDNADLVICSLKARLKELVSDM